ncbi:MAG: DUF488 family protein [Candidatus Methylomirabilales bacterium]
MERGAGLRTIYTIGSSTRPLPEFLGLLQGYEIAVLVDVRMFPHSKRFPHFSKKVLEENIPSRGLRYVYLGKELGGYRRGGYAAYMQTPQFARGLDILESIGREARAAFMCCERLPWRCHRRFIAADLERRGWRTVHIIEKDRIWQSSMADR